MNGTHTRIVCTLGPATQSEEMIRALMQAGMDVVRLNFSHGTHEWHCERIALVRRVATELGSHVAILQDLCGPKIRLGAVREGAALEADRLFVLTCEEVEGDSERAQVTYPGLAAEVCPGDPILLDDGLLELRVEEVRGREIVTRVVEGGPLFSRKGVNLPGTRLSVPALTPKDEQDLRFGLAHGVDLVALSFVRQASDLDGVRAIMAEVGVLRPVIVKVEKREAVENLEAIVASSDGVMVARGDLGIEVPLEDVPMIQKRTIRLGLELRRPVITATQMLDSMIRNPRPTRAETTDVANAILDGTDAVMLSGETASGAYPLQAVQVMERIARRTEPMLTYLRDLPDRDGDPQVCAVAQGACELAEQLGARVILACTTSGRTVQAIARHRPRAGLLGVTPEPHVARQLNLVWGVTPVLSGRFGNSEELVEVALQAARDSGRVVSGEPIVLVAGVPAGSPTNMIQVVTAR